MLRVPIGLPLIGQPSLVGLVVHCTIIWRSGLVLKLFVPEMDQFQFARILYLIELFPEAAQVPRFSILPV